MYSYVLSKDGFPDHHFNSFREVGKFFKKSGQHVNSMVRDQKSKKDVYLYEWKFKKIPKEKKTKYTKRDLLKQIFDEIDKNGTLKLRQLAKIYKEER